MTAVSDAAVSGRTVKPQDVYDDNGDYVGLEGSTSGGGGDVVSINPKIGEYWWWWWRWWKWIVLSILLGVLIFVVIKWVGPFFVKKEIIPVIDWEIATFSTPVLAFLIFASVALFPVVLFPSTPSMWVAGMTFGYGIGFLIVIAGVAVGVSLPYFIGFLFQHKIHQWLEKHPKKASIVRVAGEGSWFHQFQAITLIRISPFPYVIFNYVVVATHVNYCPYFLGSLTGMVPEVFIALYSGILIRTLADAAEDEKALSTQQIIFNALGFSTAVAATIIIGIYAKRRLDQLREEEEQLLESV